MYVLRAKYYFFAIIAVLIFLVIPGHSAANGNLQTVSNSGDLLSCGKDNQNGNMLLCFTVNVSIYQKKFDVSNYDHYVIVLMLRSENSTVHAYMTENYVNFSVPNQDSIVGWLPQGGCWTGSQLAYNENLFSQQPEFYLEMPTGCVESSIDQGTYRNFLFWHECASDIHCPYDRIDQGYIQFLVEIDVPKNNTVSFDFTSKAVMAMPGSCCLNNILASSQLEWSPVSGVSKLTVQPPSTPWQKYWPFIIIGIVGAAIATPVLGFKTPRYFKANGEISSRPRGIEFLSISSIIIGIAFTLGGLSIIASAPISTILASFGITVRPYPFWVLGLGTGIFMTLAGIGSWNGRNWAWEADILGAGTGIVIGTLLAFFTVPVIFNVLVFVAFIIFCAYDLNYLQKPQVKQFFHLIPDTSK